MKTRNALGISMSRSIKSLAVCILMATGSFGYAGPRDDEVATVQVYKEASASSVTYTYSVTNRSEFPLTSVTVGFDYYRGNPELSGTHPQQIIVPSGWDGYVVALEESDKYEVTWHITNAGPSIKPGQTLSGFKIVMPREDTRLTSSNWTVVVGGPPVSASSQLLLVQGPPPSTDSVPPVLVVKLSPDNLWPPNRRMVEISATIVVSDNNDPSPTVKLVSIVCNDCDEPAADIRAADIGTDDRVFLLKADCVGKRKEGRVYTVTYSATDRAGNAVTSQATVNVPHDLRR